MQWVQVGRDDPIAPDTILAIKCKWSGITKSNAKFHLPMF